MSNSPITDAGEREALIHREVTQLVVLVLIAIAAFFVTRAVAVNNHDLSMRNADEWYRRGQGFVADGRLDEAVDAFRRATVRNRTDRTYLLSLSRALAQKRDYDSARAMLLGIRESAPEDAEINLDLARLSAARQDVTEALRFFHDALYAPWPASQAERRRAVRVELIRFLLTHGQSSRAQSELLAAGADLPDDVPHHVQLAELFSQAGDHRDALEHFQHALRLAPQDDAALAGAGQAAFGVGDYALARRYLRQAQTDSETVRALREVVDLIVSRDPAASRIGAAERYRRLDANLSYVEQRLAGCVAQHDNVPSDNQRVLQTELQAFARPLRPSVMLDQDTIETGIDLIERVERGIVDSCGPQTAVDRALLLIGRQHAAGNQ